MEPITRFLIVLVLLIPATVNSASIQVLDYSPAVEQRASPRQVSEGGNGTDCPIRHEIGEKCPPSCNITADCTLSQICTCDGGCGLSCVDPESAQVLRRKRKAIKTGGSNVLRSKYGGGRGGGGGRRSFRRKKTGVEGAGADEDYGDLQICEELDPLIDVEVIESGKDDDNDTYSDGAVLNVTCGFGHYVNLANQIAKCVKGEWKPKLPQCKANPCKVPYIEHGWCYEGSKMLYFEELIRYGKSINIHCVKRYKLIGISKMLCQFGEWEIQGGYPPECVPVNNTNHDLDHPASAAALTMNTALKRGCGMPPPERGALLHVEGRPMDPVTESHGLHFEDGTDILYKCMGQGVNKTLKRNRWVRTCNDGIWGGNSLPCDGEIDHEMVLELLNQINRSCIYEERQSNLVLFYENSKRASNKSDEFQTNTIITSRCSDIGKFEFTGAIHRKCVSGQWLGVTPKCEGLSQLHDYALDKDPTILFRYVNGSIGQSNSGELVIYPGTTVYMECLYIHKFGPPKWEVKRSSTVDKEYVQGWTDNIPDRFADLEYRITIPEADEDDSGEYTCKTPSRHSHTVRVVVRATTCPELPTRSNLVYSNLDRQLGAEVNISCDGSYSLVGEKNLTCLGNGMWSAHIPKCEKVTIKCPDPPDLTNGIVTGTPPYTPGDVVHYECKYGYIMEGGQAVSVCGNNRKWSKVPGLICEQACTYPGTIVSGSITPVKFYYKVHETIMFDCNEGHELRGAGMVHCLPGAHWSNSLPTCARK